MILAGDFIPQGLSVKLPNEFKGRTVLANLEGPICADGLLPSGKVGVCLHTTTSEQLAKLVEQFAFSLANNHMMDFREQGLRETREFLTSNGVSFSGAGDCELEARKPMFVHDAGSKVAVFSCCERQFGIATGKFAGCAEKGVWLYDAIQAVKSSGQADYVIVSCHAANEFSPWVSPDLHDFYHSLIDVGADCIHGHHSHVPQGYEVYKDRPIFYGLGNFVVDARQWSENKNQLWSLVAKVEFGKDVKWQVEPYLVYVDGNVVSVEKVDGEQKKECMQYLDATNRQFKSREMLIACWQEVSTRLYRRLYSKCLRSPSLQPYRLNWNEALHKIMFLLADIYHVLMLSERPTRKSKFYGKVLYNYFNCASHHESIATALGVLTGSECDFRTFETSRLAEVLMINK